jgi:uncharacterized protein YjbJ (UPF0337 family)
MSGTTDKIKGPSEGGVGSLTNDRRLKNQGKADQTSGAIKYGIERVVDSLRRDVSPEIERCGLPRCRRASPNFNDNGGLTMKIFLLMIVFATLTGGLASAGVSCVNNNSQHCRDARAAFAEHHNGKSPNQWYQGHQGRWNQQGHAWQWRSDDGREYRQGQQGWQWSDAARINEHNHDRDHD